MVLGSIQSNECCKYTGITTILVVDNENWKIIVKYSFFICKVTVNEHGNSLKLNLHGKTVFYSGRALVGVL